jgi:tRNA nucleotidyltransferase/poly(A) polymerase
LRAKIIRTIGAPEERFGEDHLRMLRAVRFAARLDFEIEPQTLPPSNRSRRKSVSSAPSGCGMS